MIQRAPCFPTRLSIAVSASMLALCGCATAPRSATAPEVGGQASVQGQVVRVDTTPWTYDGNAVVTVLTPAGEVAVQFPARWNLCRAPAPGDLQALKAGDQVKVVGIVTAPAELVVCAQPEHGLTPIK